MVAKFTTGLNVVLDNLTDVAYEKFAERPGGCQRGITMPENGTEAANDFAGRSLANASFPDGSDENPPHDSEEEPPEKDSTEQGGTDDHDKDGNQVATQKTPIGCGIGKPSHLFEVCLANRQLFCHCQECSFTISDSNDDDEYAPEEDDTPQVKEEPLKGIYSLGVEEQIEQGELDEPKLPVLPDTRQYITKKLQFKSSYGGPIQKVFGTYIVQGNVMQITSLDKATQTFSVVVAVCKGVIQNVARIWFGDIIVFDTVFNSLNRNTLGVSVDIYDGREAQKVFRGVVASIDGAGFGRTPAYRGTMCIVINNIRVQDLEVITKVNEFPEMKIEVMEEITTTNPLTSDSSRFFSNEFFFKDARLNRIYGTTNGPETWPEDNNVIDYSQDPKFVNVKEWDAGFFDIDAPYSITREGAILQKYIGYNMDDSSYMKFENPIDFVFDKYRTNTFSTDLYSISVVHQPTTKELYVHYISKKYKCAYSSRLSYPKAYSNYNFLGVNYTSDITSYLLQQSTLVAYRHRGQQIPETTVMTLKDTATGGTPPMAILGTTKFLFFLENKNQMVIVDHNLQATPNIRIESTIEYDTQPPRPSFSRVVDSDYFYYISRDNKIIEVDMIKLTFTEVTDVTLPGTIENYWYDAGQHSLIFVYDNKMWTFKGRAVRPVKVSIQGIYEDLLELMDPHGLLNFDASALSSIEIDGLLVDDSFAATFDKLNQLFAIDTIKEETITLVPNDPSAIVAMPSFFANQTMRDVIINYTKASLKYKQYDLLLGITDVTTIVKNPLQNPRGSTYDKTKSFALNLIANDVDFRPVLEAHLVSIRDVQTVVETSAKNLLLRVGDVTASGKITDITDEPDYTRTVTIEPSEIQAPTSILPLQPVPLNYLVDNTTVHDQVIPNILFLPALTPAHRSIAIDNQVAYTVVETAETSSLSDSIRQFQLPVRFTSKIRSDLQGEVWYYLYDDYWRNGPWNGRQAAVINRRSDGPIFDGEARTVTSIDHSHAAHSGITKKTPDNIGLNNHHRTTDVESVLIVRFHHKNTIRFLKNQTRLELHNEFLNNLLVVGQEYIQYQTFTVDADGRTVTFTGLHRAQRGTDAYTNSHRNGEKVYLYTEDTFNLLRLNRLSTFRQPSVEMVVQGSANTYIVKADAGSARPLAPLDIKFEYSPGATDFTVKWKGRSELFYDMLEDQSSGQAKLLGNLGDGITQGLYMVMHILTRPFDLFEFEQELIHAEFNPSADEPLIWFSTSKKMNGTDIDIEYSLTIQADKLNEVGIFPDTQDLYVVMHYGMPTEQYYRGDGAHIFKEGIVGYPSYHVRPAGNPITPTQLRLKKQSSYTVLTAQ